MNMTAVWQSLQVIRTPEINSLNRMFEYNMSYLISDYLLKSINLMKEYIRQFK
jgi:hypothetical protein